MSPHPLAPSPAPSPHTSPGEGEQQPRGAEELQRIERELRHALAEIRYGSIEIVIQDSRVVQIERREKVRFDRPAGQPEAASRSHISSIREPTGPPEERFRRSR